MIKRRMDVAVENQNRKASIELEKLSFPDPFINSMIIFIVCVPLYVVAKAYLQKLYHHWEGMSRKLRLFFMMGTRPR